MAAVYNPGFTAVKKSGDADSFIHGNFGVLLEVLVLKDLTAAIGVHSSSKDSLQVLMLVLMLFTTFFLQLSNWENHVHSGSS